MNPYTNHLIAIHHTARVANNAGILDAKTITYWSISRQRFMTEDVASIAMPKNARHLVITTTTGARCNASDVESYTA